MIQFGYIERFHNSLIQQRIDAKEPAFRLLIKSPVGVDPP